MQAFPSPHHYEMHNVFSDYTWLIYGMMVTSYVQNYCQSFSRSLNKMLSYSVAGIVLTFSTALFSILLIPSYGVVGYAYALILAQLAATLYSFVTAGCYKYIQVRGNSYGAVKEMLAYSAPLLPNGIMWWLVNGINRPIMEHFLGLAAIGIYAVANKFTGMSFWCFGKCVRRTSDQ
jgi:O-antigen/teichoic acid export membrane protein